MGNEAGLEEEEVDKKIEATLPRAEQSTVARSRKSSYMLRIFDKAEPSEETKQQDDISRQTLSDRNTKETRGTVEGRISTRQPSPVAEESDNEDAEHQTAQDKDEDGVRYGPNEVVPIGHTGWVDQLTRKHSDNYFQPSKHTSYRQQQEDELSPDEAGLSRQSTISTIVNDGEGEVVEKEHVTSAVYYPHRPADHQAGERMRSPSKPRLADEGGDQMKKKKDSEQKPHQNNEDRGIELSLQSKDESHYLQGDLPVLTRVSSRESQSYYRSESEVDASEDEQPVSDRLSETKNDPDELGIDARYAIDLKPFSHQVGGHSSVYRVSRKAICKKVNNKENKFYETVERYHPELLAFMPR